MPFALPHRITAGAVARASELQENFDAIHQALNGGLDGAAITDRSISSTQIGLGEVKTANIDNKAVTLPLLDPALSVARLVPKTTFANGVKAWNSYTAEGDGFVAIPDMTFTVNPSVDSVVVVTGMVAIGQIGDKLTNLYAAIKEGTTPAGAPLVQGQAYTTQVANFNDKPYQTIPVCGFLEPVTGRTTTYTLMFKSSLDGAVSIIAEGGRTMLNVTIQPKTSS